ncbi:MAG TPA: hypothetical protein VN922_19715 [Bacteroidia bacterium]|nr:hypothetical protein [Bacteroidia bacterium]
MNSLILSTQKACDALVSSGLIEDGIDGANTLQAENKLLAKLKSIFAAKNYTWHINNLIGIRMDDNYTNQFTDYCIITTVDKLIAFPISTKPGKSYLDKPENAAGCACLKEGQYIDMWKFIDAFGGWSGDPYMQQNKPCNVYRELHPGPSINRNAKIDTGIFGVNFHTWKNFNGNLVQNLSAGCQVMNENVLVVEVLPYLELVFTGVPVTYTLLHKNDFV